MLYGPDGRPIQSVSALPISREIAVATVRDSWSTYPSSGLTPGKLARILREADQGDLYRQAELFEEMEEKDTHLASVLGTRKTAVLGVDWDVMAYSDDKADQEVAAFVTEALDAVKGLEGAFLDLLDAIGKGYSVGELMWEVRDGRAWVGQVKWRHQKRFAFDDAGERVKLLTDSSPMGEDIPENKFVVHLHKARSGHPSRQGLVRVCAWMYLFKNYSVKDWVQFAEVYGQPLRLGKYDPQATPADREALLAAVTQLGTDAAGIISKSTEIEFVETSQRSGDIYSALASFCDAQMSKAVLGQTLTTEVGDRGSYAASKTHGEVRQDILEADCKSLAETLRRDLIRPLALFNFGPDALTRLPWVKFHYEPPEDLKSSADVYSILVGQVGLPVATEHIYEKFGVPKPAAGQALVVPPAAAPVPSPQKASHRALRLSDVPDGQDAVDRLADESVRKALAPVGDMASEILSLIERSKSLEHLRDKIVALYGNLSADALEELVARAMYAADLYGRWTALG
jgi:phage gp29-like protein